MIIHRVSMATGVQHSRDIDVTQEQLDDWMDGTLIQRAMPHLSASDREFIISGITQEEWDELFKEDADDE